MSALDRAAENHDEQQEIVAEFKHKNGQPHEPQICRLCTEFKPAPVRKLTDSRLDPHGQPWGIEDAAGEERQRARIEDSIDDQAKELGRGEDAHTIEEKL